MNYFNEAIKNQKTCKEIDAQMPSSFYVRFCVDRSDVLTKGRDEDVSNISRFFTNNDPQYAHMFFEQVSLKYEILTSCESTSVSDWQSCFLRRKSLLLDRRSQTKGSIPGFFLAPLNEASSVYMSVSDYTYKTDARFAGLIATCLTMQEHEGIIKDADKVEESIRKTLYDLVLIHLKNNQIKAKDKSAILEAFYLFLEFLRPKPIDK